MWSARPTTLRTVTSMAITVYNDDPTPTLTVQGYEMDEGASGTSELRFRATLSTYTHFYDVTFTYGTVDGTATSPSDYIAESGTVTIPAGSRYSDFFTVTVNGDTEVEFDEWFYLRVTSVEGAVVRRNTSSSPWGDILNDDLPSISVDDITVVEGTGGDSIATFTVELSAPTQDWDSVGMHTVDHTATNAVMIHLAARRRRASAAIPARPALVRRSGTASTSPTRRSVSSYRVR